MKVLVSVLFLAATTAVFAQNPAPVPSHPESNSGNPATQSVIVSGGWMTPQGFDGLRLQASRSSDLVVTLDQKGPTSACYTMRSYRFSRLDPKSDATKLSGYSTCQSGARLQLRDSAAPGR